MIEMVPVVEMAGWSYSELPSPTVGTRFEHPDAWDLYHQRCLAEVGVTGLTSVVRGAPLFRVGDLDQTALRRLVAKTFSDLELTPSETDEAAVQEYVAAISGGIVLRVGGDIVIEPGCCCGLDSIADWDRGMASRDWREIWVGHEQRRLEAMAADDMRLFRWKSWDGGEWSDSIVTTRREAEGALHEAREQLQQLAERIPAVLPDDLDVRVRRAMGRRLAGT